MMNTVRRKGGPCFCGRMKASFYLTRFWLQVIAVWVAYSGLLAEQTVTCYGQAMIAAEGNEPLPEISSAESDDRVGFSPSAIGAAVGTFPGVAEAGVLPMQSLPALLVTIQIVSSCRSAAENSRSVSSDDVPSVPVSISVRPLVVTIQTPAESVEMVEVWNRGQRVCLDKQLGPGSYQWTWDCPSLGVQLFQARYKSRGIWSDLSAPVQFHIQLPEAPRIISVTETGNHSIGNSTDRSVRISTGSLLVQLAGAFPEDLLLAEVDGRSVSVFRQPEPSDPSAHDGSAPTAVMNQLPTSVHCRVWVQLHGQIPPGSHTLIIRRKPCGTECGVASRPSNRVAFHYYQPASYVLGPQFDCCLEDARPTFGPIDPSAVIRPLDAKANANAEPASQHEPEKVQRKYQAEEIPVPSPGQSRVRGSRVNARGEISLLKRSEASGWATGSVGNDRAPTKRPPAAPDPSISPRRQASASFNSMTQFVALWNESLIVEANSLVQQATTHLLLITKAAEMLKQIENQIKRGVEAVELRFAELNEIQARQRQELDLASTDAGGKNILQQDLNSARSFAQIGNAAHKSLQDELFKMREHAMTGTRQRIDAELLLRDASIHLEQMKGLANQVSLLANINTAQARVSRDEIVVKLSHLKGGLANLEARVVAMTASAQAVEESGKLAEQQAAIARDEFEKSLTLSQQVASKLMLMGKDSADSSKPVDPWNELAAAEQDQDHAWEAAEIQELIDRLKRRAEQARGTKTRVDSARQRLEAQDAEELAVDAETQADARIRIAAANRRTHLADAIDRPASPIHFVSAAHFPRREFSSDGQVFEQEGLIIYEGMKFEFDRKGNYNVSFRSSLPHVPVVLQLQFLLQPAPGAAWYTITLPPITIRPRDGQGMETHNRLKSDRKEGSHGAESCCGDVHQCSCEGYSEILKLCYAQLSQHTQIRRIGVARFGYGSDSL